jgi:hypothetical protein
MSVSSARDLITATPHGRKSGCLLQIFSGERMFEILAPSLGETEAKRYTYWVLWKLDWRTKGQHVGLRDKTEQTWTSTKRPIVCGVLVCRGISKGAPTSYIIKNEIIDLSQEVLQGHEIEQLSVAGHSSHRL